jgi:hypothetical protein
LEVDWSFAFRKKGSDPFFAIFRVDSFERCAVAIYVKNNNDFEQTEPIVRECPHCGAQAPLVPIATPGFAELSAARPQHAGVAFRCAVCNEPRFARAAVRSFGEDRIVLSANLVEVERSKEHFQYNYLPERVQRLLREAFGCYTADLFLAFAILCRRTVTLSQATGAASQNPAFENLFGDAVTLGQIDTATRATLHEVLFGSDAEPEIDADQAAVLIEIIKDMFQQRFVRTAKLRRAIKMRRYFASEAEQKVTPLDTMTSKAHSAKH